MHICHCPLPTFSFGTFAKLIAYMKMEPGAMCLACLCCGLSSASLQLYVPIFSGILLLEHS
uniref:Uncharacterized protein n=1 Tax=Arundo donax TaxID=35708 RepID=A0A0A9TBK7_ARUDO